MLKLVVRPKPWSLGLYLGFTAVVLPLLSIIRALGLGEPGELRNMLLPVLLLFMVLAFGAFKVARLRSWLQLLLALALVQAVIVGLLNGRHEDDTRNFLSHLFQLGSAYLMVGIGWLCAANFSRLFWRNWTVLSLGAIAISTMLTVDALQRGDIGRLYTPAYGLILIVAYSTVFFRGGVLASFLLALVSNKRAVVLAVLLQTGHQWWRRTLFVRGSRYLVWAVARAAVFALLVVGAGWVIVEWAGNYPGDSGFARAVNISMDRLEPLVTVFAQQTDLTALSAGRDIEIVNAVEQSRWWYWIFGGGAGWGVDIGSDGYVHNIHTSPLSLALVFGVPFSMLLYGTMMWMLVRSFRLSLHSDDATSQMAPVYLSGALMHSLFAYSLFVDLLVFFFAGVVARNLAGRTRTRRNPVAA